MGNFILSAGATLYLKSELKEVEETVEEQEESKLNHQGREEESDRRK